jgi:RHS repeat-associated protein
MKFKIYCLSLILLLSFFFNLNSALAGTLTATLGSDGVIVLDADFSTDFDCVPEGQTPRTTIAEGGGCYSVTAEGWTAQGERALACANLGHTWNYNASSSGGRHVNGICVSRGASASTSVVETTAKDVEITAPEGRIPKAILNIDVDYDFKYQGADCSGLPTNRQVSVNGGGVHSNLPVSGMETFSYNFSNSSGTIMLTASACCNGSCKNTNKYVYIEPDDLGNGGPDPKSCPLPGSTLVGKPVNVANGNVFISQTDFSLSGVMPINFTRYYNSKGTEAGGFNTKWRHTFDTKATASGNSYKIINADGSIFYYMDNDDDNIYLPVLPRGIKSRVIKNPDDSLKREFYDGSKEEFNKYGYLTGVVDRNGNRIILTSDSGNKLVKITDPVGREINIIYDTYSRITQIILPDGRILGYTYISGMLQKVTYPDGTYRTYEYSGYNLTGIKDENNHYIEKHTYDAQGRGTTSSVDGTNERLSIDYTDDAHSTVTDSLGRITTYTINKSGGKSHATNISGPGCSSCGQGDTSYTYDDNLNVTSTTDANGNTTIMTYDADGNMLTKTEAYGTVDERTTTYTYNDFGQVLAEEYDDGVITKYTYYDDTGLLKTKTEAFDPDVTTPTTIYTYYGPELYHQLETVEDPNHNFTAYTYAYDENDRLTKTEYKYLENATLTTVYVYDKMGNLESVTDANGNTTTYEYDSRYRLNKEIRPDGGTTKYEYDTLGNRTKIIEVINETEERTLVEYKYDVDRLTDIIDFDGNVIKYTYDTESNMKTMELKDAAGNIKMSEEYKYYPDHNWLWKAIRPDNDTNPDNNPYTEQTYYPDGSLWTKRDENGNITTFTYDKRSRLKTVRDAYDNITSYTYYTRDNLETVTDARGNVTRYDYDKHDRLISTISPDTGTTSFPYTYEGRGIKISKTDANNVTTIYRYDELDRLTSIQFPDPAQNIYYYYDETDSLNGQGKLTTMTDPSGTTWDDYDTIGRLKMETKQINNITYRTEYSYDPINGNLLTVTYPSGRVLTYTYNGQNKVKSVTDTYLGETRPLVISDISYWPFGDINTLTYGNTLQRTVAHDNRYRINSITTGSLQNLTYDHYSNENIHYIIDNLNPSKTKDYTYDSLNRLKIAAGQWGAITYDYDDVGNRTYETTDTGNTTYNYPANTNRLSSATGEKNLNLSYDNNGNTTLENNRQYIYNYNQRLIRVTENGITGSEYVYNGNGQRVKKWVSNGNQCTIFHYDQNGLLIAESTGTGTITAEYVYLNGQPLAKIENNNVYYYHNDHLGAPMMMTDYSGAVVWQGEFKPFGEPVSVTGSITNNLRFPGQYYDSETGLHQNYFRDYEPEMGRYVESDPIGLEGGLTLFAYVGNSPVNKIDPYGLCPGNKQKCIQNVLQQNYGNFVANTLVPEFSTISIFTNTAAWLKGSAISGSIKGIFVGLPWLASKIATTTGNNLAVYPGMASASSNALASGAFWGNTAATLGGAITVGVTGASAFATAANAYAMWVCRNVPD